MSGKVKFKRGRLDEGSYRLLILIAKHYRVSPESIINQLITDYNNLHIDSILHSILDDRPPYESGMNESIAYKPEEPLESSGGSAPLLGGVGGRYVLDSKEFASKLAELSVEKFLGNTTVKPPKASEVAYTLEECIRLSTIDAALKVARMNGEGAGPLSAGIRVSEMENAPPIKPA